MIAAARLVCPKSLVRIAAGRELMSRELQALCFLVAQTRSLSARARSRPSTRPGT